MKPQSYFMAIDIEMSGALLRRNHENALTDMHSAPVSPEGDIIGIGAQVLRWNEETEQVEGATFRESSDGVEDGSFFRPMFRPLRKFQSFGTLYTQRGKGLQACSVSKNYKKTSRIVRTYVGLNGLHDDAGIVYPHEVEEHTVFEGRCWVEFWSKHPEKLKELEYKGFLSRRDMEKEAILQLFRFRAIWELEAAEDGCKLILVSDNVAFDIGMVDQLMKRYKPISYPSVYCASRGTDKNHPDVNNKYNGGTPCTHSMQKGLLAAVDPLWILSDSKDAESEWMEWLMDENEVTEEGKPLFWSSTARIRYLYDIPKPDVVHDHNPANDAYTIAYEYAAIQLIAMGHYTLKGSRAMKKRPAPKETEEHDEGDGTGKAKKAKKGKEKN